MAVVAHRHPVARPTVAHGRRRGQRGAALLEMSIVFALLALLLFGIISYGVTMSYKQTMAQATNEAARQSAVQQNEVQSTALAGLKADFENIAEYAAELAELQKAIPSTNDLSTFIGELKTLEDKSKVVLTNFGSSEAQPFVLDVGLPEPEVVEPAEGEEAPATPAPPVAPVVPEGTPVQTVLPEEFVAITVAMTVEGGQANILNFINALQNGDRRYLVASIDISYNKERNTYTGTVEGYVYVLIDPRNPTGAETPDTDNEEEEPEEEEAEPSSTPTPPIPTETPAP